MIRPEGPAVIFKTQGYKTPTGNFTTEATCKGRDRHTVYKNPRDKGVQTCPYDNCGHDLH